jgi:succinate dehydrogenase/fumarate reductase flavoprotein subunit
MITNIDDAQHEMAAATEDAVADSGCDPDEIAYDMVVAVAWNCDDDTARELCRRELGDIPFDLRGRLGTADWVQ